MNPDAVFRNQRLRLRAPRRDAAERARIALEDGLATADFNDAGRLILNGYQMLFSGYWWISALPGLALVLLVLGVNLLGDWLREAMNPKLAR